MKNIFSRSLKKYTNNFFREREEIFFTYFVFISTFHIFFQSEGEPPVSFASLSEDPPPLTFEPVVAEVESEDDNKYIFQLKKECSQDQLDYCAGAKYKSGDHTMCKHCVSCFLIYFPFYRLFIFRQASFCLPFCLRISITISMLHDY